MKAYRLDILFDFIRILPKQNQRRLNAVFYIVRRFGNSIPG